MAISPHFTALLRRHGRPEAIRRDGPEAPGYPVRRKPTRAKERENSFARTGKSMDTGMSSRPFGPGAFSPCTSAIPQGMPEQAYAYPQPSYFAAAAAFWNSATNAGPILGTHSS